MIVAVQVDRLQGLRDIAPALDALDLVVVGDPLSVTPPPVGCDPLSIAAWLMTLTDRVALAACVGLDWAPFHVARALASFDRLSAGRAGWVPVDYHQIPPDRAAEHMDVVLKLFDSWEDDALVLDKANSVFADRTKVHRIRHAGAHFAVDGPLNAPRPIQGWPLLLESAARASAFADLVVGPLETLPMGGGALRLVTMPCDPGAGEASAQALAETMASLVGDNTCDGFLLAPVRPERDIAALAHEVIPRLAVMGFEAPAVVEGSTSRERLGLPRPGNRFALTASA
jgi:hypothetical protein